MPSPSISVCNIALSEVRAASIVSIDDDSPEAKACSIHYDECLQLLFEAHEWTFATVQVRLAALAVNDRGSEWTYAYELPSDIVPGLMTVVGPNLTAFSGVYYPWPYTFPRPPGIFSDFVVGDTTLYTNVASASLTYISRNVGEDRMPAQFKRALALDLASRLAIALLDDRSKKGDLIQQAEAAKRRAIAEDLNRYPRIDIADLDEVALARS